MLLHVRGAPTAVALHLGKTWVYGALINNIWSVSEDEGRRSVNQMLLQPFVNHNFADAPGRYLTFAPVIAAGGTTFGIAWVDKRDGPDGEIYFTRFSSAGTKLGVDVRVTNAADASFDPVIAWSGSEWSIAWDDLRTGNEEIFFGRVDATGVKVGSDTQVSNAAGNSRHPSIVWAGGKYGVVWSDDRDGLNDEIYFTPIGCDCVDGDGDGSSSCVDCDDGDDTVYPGAPQACTGITNDCNNPVWPVPLGATDEDGDGIAPCDGDCDDTHAAVYPGAPQICDHLNNNCSWPSWPYLDGTNEKDNDGDGYSTCDGDCTDASSSVWATPGEARSVLLQRNVVTNVTTLFWQAPTAPGGISPFYDTIRSSDPSNFSAGAVCVETNNGPNTTATDSVTPNTGQTLYYLVRAENLCPPGLNVGPLGTNSAGVPRTARTCP